MRSVVKATAVQSEIALPFVVKPTVPVGVGDPAGVTVAVNVTDSGEVEGFGLEVKVVVLTVAVLLFTIWVSAPLLPALLLSPK